MAPPPPAGTPPPPAGGLKKLKWLDLDRNQITDAGCAALVAALDSGALPALEELTLHGISASAAAIDAVREALTGKIESRNAAMTILMSLFCSCRARVMSLWLLASKYLL